MFRIQLQATLSVPLEVLTARPTYNLNDLPLSRESLQILSSNIRQKRHKIRNLHEIVLDFSLSNSRSILANSSFGNIGANNENDQENFTFGTIYKSSDQTAENKTNLECKPVIMKLQGVKRPRLILEEKETRKQAKLAKREAVKLEAAK